LQIGSDLWDVRCLQFFLLELLPVDLREESMIYDLVGVTTTSADSLGCITMQ
jgi:hypothetical protein